MIVLSWWWRRRQAEVAAAPVPRRVRRYGRQYSDRYA